MGRSHTQSAGSLTLRDPQKTSTPDCSSSQEGPPPRQGDVCLLFFNTRQASDHTFALQPNMRTFFPSQTFSLSSIGAFKVNQPLSAHPVAARPHPGRELGLDLWLQFNSSVKCLAIFFFFLKQKMFIPKKKLQRRINYLKWESILLY